MMTDSVTKGHKSPERTKACPQENSVSHVPVLPWHAHVERAGADR